MSIKLFCLVKGNSATHAFPVNINWGDTIGDLKKAIKAKSQQEFSSIDAKDLKLWKVEIPDDREDLLNALSLKDEDELCATRKISKYFLDPPAKKHIHVIIEQPVAIAPQAILSDGDIINILDPFIVKPPDPLRESLSNLVNIPDISTYLKFVDREKEVNQLMMNMEKLHYLVNNRNEYSEPKKEIRFPTAVGTSGKGKTTFARRAYEKSGIYSGVIGSDVVDAVEECRKAGRTFRIACDDISGALYSKNDHESLFGKVLLYEALKYRLKQIEYPLFIINIDETNALFESKHGYWLREVLKSLARVITDKLDRHFLFVILTGTHASDLFETVKSSNAKTEDISLPLLKSEHAEEVLFELANRGVVDEAKRINKLSEHTKYAIMLLGVVGRFLEAMIFQMSVIGSSVANNEFTYNVAKFYQSGLRYYLEKCQYESKYCDELLIRTKKHINEKYQRYFDHFQLNDNRELIPHVVAYSLFEWPVQRSDTIGIKNKRKIEVSNI
ncbi:hypothetical protein Glove_566g41 [Diversispora epigaea]|uniref:Crinkler effector protein N-terminal domain-containing protein n=1 Tax=Diversispora epigaea TaxID=1348612 RepID=A0A397GDY4_9GLOM|nr:hypothetical protein Glove_566g41 [Diversispora epigaea]